MTATPDIGPDAYFQQQLEAGRIQIQKCDSCGAHVFAPRTFCKSCGKDALSWVDISGKGEVYSNTTVRKKPEDGGDYCFALIDLAEGVRMISTVVGTDPHDVRIGMPLRAEIEDHKGAKRIVFRVEEVGR